MTAKISCLYQGINQKTSWKISSRIKELLYPNNSSYSYNRGGTADGLSAIGRERIVEYHRRFYRLENILAVVQGGTTAREAVLSLRETERRALERGRAEIDGWEPAELFDASSSPWPEEDVEETFEYASTDESTGSVALARRLPPGFDLVENMTDLHAFNVFLDPYLTSSSFSPLKQLKMQYT